MIDSCSRLTGCPQNAVLIPKIHIEENINPSFVIRPYMPTQTTKLCSSKVTVNRWDPVHRV